MKKITFFILLSFGFSHLSNSQCTTNATSFGNNSSIPMYNVQGTIQVTLNTNNTVTVNLASNFATAAGPDVRIFLVDRGTLTDAQLKTPAMFNARPKIEMGLSPASGMASFTKVIPSGMNISEFETVYFYCQAFNAFWDFGSFTPFTTVNCSVLETNDFESNKLQLYPNPANDKLNIQLEATSTNYQVAIYNSLGSVVFENSNQSNATTIIDISELNSGIYFVKITDSENNIYQKRLLKK